MEIAVVNWKFVFRITGFMLVLESLFTFISAGVSVFFGETPVPFILSGIITLACGLALSLPTHVRTKINLIGKKESFVTVTLSWLLFALLGSLPFLLSGKISTFPDAFFESTSGITTTGATILNNIEAMPKGLLFWRSLLQWLGGMGIIVFSLILLPMLGGEAAQLFEAESSVPSYDRFRPRVAQMAKRIWGIYLILTIVLAFLLYLFHMEPFDAVCHALSTISTGGFSTKQLSVSYWHSIPIEIILCIFMLIGSINFSLIYFLIKGQFRKFFFDEELRWFLGIILLAAVTVAMVLFIHPAIDIRLKDAFRVAIFQVISVISTTGFYTGDYIQWGTFFWILFLFLMVICGCSGSTSGGMKTVRALVLVKNMRCEFNRLLHPRAIISVRLNGRVLSLEVVQRLMAFVFLYIFIIVFSWGIFVLAGVPFAEALGASVTSIGNVGPGFGVYGPAGSFADIPSFVKIYMSFLMIVGRLEIFTVLILFTSEFWKK